MPIPNTATDAPYQAHAINMAEVKSENLLKARPNPIFFLGHHPDNWEIAEVPGENGDTVSVWLPELMQIPVVPGVNGCRTLRDGEPREAAYAGMLKWLADEGVIVILPDAVVGETASYIHYTDCAHPKSGVLGRFHHDAWSRPKPTKKGRTVKLRRDNLAANAWRLELVKRGWSRPDGTTGRLPDMDLDIKGDAEDLAKHHLGRKEAETQLPERAYRHEVEAREAIVALHEGAVVPSYIGADTTPVADYSDAIRAILVARVKAGDNADEVIASVPDLDEHIIEAIYAAVPAPKPITTKKGK